MLSYADIERRIEITGRKIEQILDEVTHAAQEAALAEATFKAEFAQARLKARAAADRTHQRLTTDQAEDIATDATSEQRQDHLLAASRLLVAREALRARQTQMDALRTLAASHRAAGG